MENDFCIVSNSTYFFFLISHLNLQTNKFCTIVDPLFHFYIAIEKDVFAEKEDSQGDITKERKKKSNASLKMLWYRWDRNSIIGSNNKNKLHI